MTVRDVANVLNVGESTVKRAIEKLSPVLGALMLNNYGGYLLSEYQVTTIKQEIQKHHNLTNRKIDKITTEQEENETIVKALSILKQRADEYKRRAELAEATNARLLHCDTTFSTTEIAKELNMPSAFCLNRELEYKGFIYKDKRGLWLLTSKYSCLNYQNIKQKEINGIVIYYAEWTNAGRNWLLKMFEKDGN